MRICLLQYSSSVEVKLIQYKGSLPMNPKALYSLSCGVFFLGTKYGNILNACITNTCIQVASNPVRIAISILNQSYTCQLIKESKSFSISVLDKSCGYDFIERFGFQSGRNVDKFSGFSYSLDVNGNPYPNNAICALFSAKVVSMHDLGTHTLFIAEVNDAQTMSSRMPITYSDYQKNIKPKSELSQQKKIIGWKCRICGYIYKGEKLPSDFVCPTCGHPAEDFEPVYENP